MTLFDNKQDTNLKACVEMVEEALRRLGVDPDKARIEAERGPAWALARGSAELFVFLSRADGENTIQVVAPVMRPPDDPVRLYPRLLELNANAVVGAAFGLKDGEVVLTADRSTTGLDRVEVDEMVRRIGEYADHYDDVLVAEFGGARATDE